MASLDRDLRNRREPIEVFGVLKGEIAKLARHLVERWVVILTIAFDRERFRDQESQLLQGIAF